MCLVTDSQKVLIEKDIEWSAKFLFSSEQSVSKQSTCKSPANEQQRNTQVNSSVDKVLTIQLNLKANNQGLFSVKNFFFHMLMTPLTVH